MALLFMDSFNHYATADMTEKWTSTSSTGGGTLSIGATNGRRGGPGLRVSGSVSGASCLASKTLAPADPTTIIVGFSLTVSAAPTTTAGAAQFRVLDGGTTQWSLVLLNDLRLRITLGGVTGTTIATSGVTGISLGVTAYVEAKVVIHPSAGTVDVRVNGVSVLSATGLNTRSSANNAWTSALLGITTGPSDTHSGNTDYDDLYILDGSGDAPWNTFLGDCRVDACYPTAAGATTGWTPSAGANWQCVDEPAPNDDTDYTSAAAAGPVDTFTVQDAPAGMAILGVQHNLSMKKTDAGTCTVAAVVRHGGTDYVSADLAPSTAYAYGLVVQQLNPGTGAAWTEAQFNAAEFGYTRTA